MFLMLPAVGMHVASILGMPAVRFVTLPIVGMLVWLPIVGTYCYAARRGYACWLPTVGTCSLRCQSWACSFGCPSWGPVCYAACRGHACLIARHLELSECRDFQRNKVQMWLSLYQKLSLSSSS
ncbi:hypothetical protein BDZ97DRAFT_1776982 [Flammula alnicola]|nr:hypothetical protein BDZ97DRAFT_1776982 [Flammula alnicola]